MLTRERTRQESGEMKRDEVRLVVTFTLSNIVEAARLKQLKWFRVTSCWSLSLQHIGDRFKDQGSRVERQTIKVKFQTNNVGRVFISRGLL